MKRTELKRNTPLRAVSPAKATLKATTIRVSGMRPAKPRKPMKQSRAARATPAESARMLLVKQLGCVCCMLNREQGRPTAFIGACEAHHLLSGGRRRGHECTIGLCHWHHRAVPPYESMGERLAIETFGPSVATGSKPFHTMYGTDDELLEFQDALLLNFINMRLALA